VTSEEIREADERARVDSGRLRSRRRCGHQEATRRCVRADRHGDDHVLEPSPIQTRRLEHLKVEITSREEIFGRLHREREELERLEDAAQKAWLV